MRTPKIYVSFKGYVQKFLENIVRQRKERQSSKSRLWPFVTALFALIVIFIFVAYQFSWDWTGFKEFIGPNIRQYQPTKTLWDWMQLLIVPVFIAAGSYFFNEMVKARDSKAAEKQAETERELTFENQHEARLQAYIDRMSELLLASHLRESTTDEEVQQVARIRTLTVLRSLDAKRKGDVLQFLQESALIHRGNTIIKLSGADFSHANLVGINLSSKNLAGVNLDKADLTGSYLSKADLSGAILTHAILAEANLSGAILNFSDLSNADIRNSRLRGTDLTSTILTGANLTGATLSGANLSGANLTGAILSGAILSEANLQRAVLHEAVLDNANLNEAILDNTNLHRANLTGATLIGVDIHQSDLSQANVTDTTFSYLNTSDAVLSDTDPGDVDGNNSNLRSVD